MDYAKYITNYLTAHTSNYGGLRAYSSIKYLVLHYTGNDGDTDEANIKYFTSPNRKASAHFFVDDDSISQSVPITNIAWHCGGNKYSDTDKTGGGKLYKIVTNSNSVGIEMCDTEKNGVYNLTQQTRYNVIKLVKALMKDLNIPIENVVRHFDVTGKYCPKYFMDETEWSKFKSELVENETSAPIPENTSNEQRIWNKLYAHFQNPYGVAGLMGNIRAESNLRPDNLQNSYEKKLGLTDSGYVIAVDTGIYDNFVHDKAGFGLAQWTYWSRKQNLYNYMKARNLSIADLDGQIDFLIEELKGYKTVYSVLKNANSVKEASDAVLTGYEKPADQSEAVKEKRAGYGLEYYSKYNKNTSNSFKVKIKADSLNIRVEPTTSSAKVGQIKDHGVYTIVEVNEAGTWGKLKSGVGWISIRPQYVTRIS